MCEGLFFLKDGEKERRSKSFWVAGGGRRWLAVEEVNTLGRSNGGLPGLNKKIYIYIKNI